MCWSRAAKAMMSSTLWTSRESSITAWQIDGRSMSERRRRTVSMASALSGKIMGTLVINFNIFELVVRKQCILIWKDNRYFSD